MKLVQYNEYSSVATELPWVYSGLWVKLAALGAI